MDEENEQVVLLSFCFNVNIRVSVTGLEDEEKERNGIYWKDQQDDDRRECFFLGGVQ